MTKQQLIDTLVEIHSQYEMRRQAWVAQFGNDKGFNSWFTGVFNKSLSPVVACWSHCAEKTQGAHK